MEKVNKSLRSSPKRPNMSNSFYGNQCNYTEIGESFSEKCPKLIRKYYDSM